MRTVDACVVCGEAQRTVVAEYNRLIFLESMWQSDLARYDYALCHGCGLTYATRRPERAEYEFLYDNFNEFLLRSDNGGVSDLTPAEREAIDCGFAPWWEIRSTPYKKSWTGKLLVKEIKHALSIMPYLLDLTLEGRKVLHLRAKTSTLVNMLHRLIGVSSADVVALIPVYAYLAGKNSDVRAVSALDFDEFTIPFNEHYALIIANHMFVHMLRPQETFEEFRNHLDEQGTLFLEGELDDTQLFHKRKNLFAELRPFHFQQYDVPVLKRVLRKYGFEPQNLCLRKDKKSEVVGVATLDARAQNRFDRIDSEILKQRLDMYVRWRDESILSLSQDRSEALFGSELASVWDRVKANGNLKVDGKGRPAALRNFAEANLPYERLALASIGWDQDERKAEIA